MNDIRNCPICKSPLELIQLQGEEVDKCPKCAGIYFDKNELESILQIVKFHQEVKLEEREIETILQEELERKLPCPHDSIIMNKSDILGYVIDVCPSCEGIWLDDKEILALKIVENHIKQNLNLYIRLA